MSRGSSGAQAQRHELFVVCIPGLEGLLAAELERLGLHHPRPRHGGVETTATDAQVWSVNLRSRLATRVLVRLERFQAEAFATLQAGLRRIDWARWLEPGGAVGLKVASANSTLFHTGAVYERAEEVLTERGFQLVPLLDAPAQVLHVRLVNDVAMLSIDASGEPLHKRGWRLETAKAPLRETLAAGLLAHSGWDRKRPVVDPFCGSGTIAIEAALTARRVAAGIDRTFAFQQWPSFDAAAYERMRNGARADEVPGKATIVAADRDEGAIAAARSNAERAGVADAIEFRVASISDLTLPQRPGWIVTNPPYGNRVGDDDLRNLYDRFATVLHERAAGWQVELISVHPETGGALVDRLRLPIEDRVTTNNGGIPVDLVRTVALRPA
ncbi:MAG: hypothetical protein R2715_21705 [Ilumatobacteraceae bacterium]